MIANSFSIIVPTHNRSILVKMLLQTMSNARESFPGTAEFLIVDSSEGDEADAIQKLCAVYNAHYLRCVNNVCKKRNLGILSAQNEIVFFTDSDCEASPDILNQHAMVYEKVDCNDVGGVLGLTLATGNLAPIWRTLQLDPSFTAAFSFAEWLEDAPWGTCTNISFRKHVLRQIGGFDDKWPLLVYGEDVDLGLRVNQAGYRIVCNPDAIVRHNSATISSLRQAFRKKFLTGQADYHLGQKHPTFLVLEYPGWSAIAILMLVALLLRSLMIHSFAPLLYGAAWLLIGVLVQAVLTARATRTGWKSVTRHALVIILEATFESGRLSKSLHYGAIQRLWTKFVYIELQILGERDKRIRQMWACIVAFLGLFAMQYFVPPK